MEKDVEMLLPHVGGSVQDTVSCPKGDRTEQDAFRIAAGNPNLRLFATERPGPAQDRQQAQHGFVFKEQHGTGRPLL